MRMPVQGALSGFDVDRVKYTASMRSDERWKFVLRRRLRSSVLAGGVSLLLAAVAQAGPAQVEALARLSLEELSNLEVTSVSKAAETLRQAPASIYVITHDDILRSGATSIPEILRLAPNIEIRQASANSYVAAARGLAGNPTAQNFSNKLLILIDGRSVYTPLFSGVYFDAQDTFLDDIDRVEVISGPGATLWGANAMNGVINIITRSADDTQGGLVDAGAGTLERNMAARYGGELSDSISYRIYAKAFKRDPMERADGASAQDGWYKSQGGFRLDWQRGNDTLTTQGDLYRGVENQFDSGDLEIIGGNVLSRWRHQGERSDWQVQAYVDQTQRSEPPGGVAFVLHTYDLELQHTLSLASHRITWGIGDRLHRYSIANSQTLLFEPSSRSLNLANVFVQDTVTLAPSLLLTAGIKFEDDPYSRWSALPDLRFSWRASDTAMFWASAARAIRSPTPFDVDVVEKLDGLVFLTGKDEFQPERVDAYELGYRGQPAQRLSFSVAAFYNEYDELRTVEPTEITLLPLHWDNRMRGHTYGLEAWGQWQVNDWWRLSPGVRLLRKDLEFKTGSSQLLGLAQAGDDARSQALLTSSMGFGRMSIDAFLRYAGALPDPALDEYYELNVRFGWQVSPQLDVSLSGSNLLHGAHQESPTGACIRDGVYGEVRWQF